MFSDEEEGEEESRGRRVVNEFDDFIEEDEFSDEERRREEEDEIRTGRRQQARFPTGLGLQVAGVDEEKMGEILEVFGDGDDYKWALDAEEDEEEGEGAGEEEQTAAPGLKDVFEPSELKSRMLTDEDNAIRVTDVPERYQLMRSVLKMGYDLTDKEFIEEQTWVAQHIVKDKESVLDDKPHLRAPLQRAVHKVLEFVSRESFEIPFIWHHRRDYLVYRPEKESNQDDDEGDDEYEPQGPDVHREREELLLNLDDMWRILYLDIEFHTILEKKKVLQKLEDTLKIADPLYTEMFDSATTLVEYQDILDYLQFRYSALIKDTMASSSESNGIEKSKRHSRFGRFERIRESNLYNLVRAFGLSAEQLAENIEADQRLHFSEDPPNMPLEAAEEYTKPDADGTPSTYSDAQSALDTAQMMLSEEIFYNPRLRKSIRHKFAALAKIDIILTDKGQKRIDESSPFYEFKYAINRTFDELRANPALFLKMLAAEADGLVDVRVSYPNYKTDLFERIFTKFFASDNVSDIATAWNNCRRVILKEASRKFVPTVVRNIKEDLKVECQRRLYYDIRQRFGQKLNQAAYEAAGSQGFPPRVLALSAGQGDFNRDAIVCVALDEEGQLVDHVKLSDPFGAEFREKFIELCHQRTPDVIGIAGFTANSRRLYDILNRIVEEEGLETSFEAPADNAEDEENYEPEFGGDNEGEAAPPPKKKKANQLEVVWVQDEVARLYQNSERSQAEFSDRPPLARYCIALARYLQSPLLEYAALGESVSAIEIHPSQKLLPKEMFQEAIDSTFIDYVNMVGVDLNEAVRNSYIGNALQYVAGLGPRKATGIQQAIESHGEYITNRNDLITEQIMTRIVFMNSVSFLIIPYDSSKRHETEVLDSTRIHPEDYELARKMAADALELDEEDIAAYENSGGVVAQLINEGADKLNDLILEEYAQELERKFNQKKLYTLQVIRSELQDHYGERRDKLHRLTDVEVFTMLTGETDKTLHPGVVVPAVVRKVGERFLALRLSSGIEGHVGTANVTDKRGVPFPSLFQVGQTVSALVLEINYREFNGQFSTREGEVKAAVESQKQRPTNDPQKWNIGQEIADKAKLLRIQEQEQGRTGRIINHPLFRPFNSRQAEEFLAPLQPGDLVIRPSSRGYDHIAITWKVADQLFQHVDVLEVDKPNEYALGRTLQVGKARYSDLDELIIMHVKAMARKVEEMMQSDKFHKGTRAQIDAWFEAYTRSGTRRSTYAFCLDHKHPGYFLLCFKTSDKAPVQSWNVKVIPNGYELLGASYADVPSLSNGFKKIFMHKLETQNQNQYRRPHY